MENRSLTERLPLLFGAPFSIHGTVGRDP